MDRNQLKSQLSEIQEISVDDSKYKFQIFQSQINQSFKQSNIDQIKSINESEPAFNQISLYNRQAQSLNPNQVDGKTMKLDQVNNIGHEKDIKNLQDNVISQNSYQEQIQNSKLDSVNQQYDKELENGVQISNQTGDDKDQKQTVRIFGLFLLSTIFMNFDSGVVPVSMKQIHQDINFNYTQIAMLGNFSYLGITFSCILAPYFFQKYNINNLLSISIILNMASCFLFCFVYNTALIYICRISMGFTQAFWVMYGPIWVNNLAPKKYQATFLGILGGFSPLGIMVGYIVTGVIVELINRPYSWRVSFAIQGVIEFVLCIFIMMIPQKDIDIYYEQKQQIKQHQTQQSNQQSNQQYSQFEQEPYQQNIQISNSQQQTILNILKNPIYRSMALHQTVLYFVAYTIQFWITTYLVNIMMMEKYIAMIVYSMLIISAPVVGVIIGGYVSDSLGGYKGRFMLSSIKLCLLFTIMSTLLAVATVFSFDIYSLAIIIWFTVFFASIQIPITTGIILSSTYFHQQGIGQGISQFFNNLLAYFFAPIFGGIIMDSFQNKQRGMVIGFRVSSFMITLSLLFISYVIYRFKSFKTAHPQIFKQSN